MAATAAEPLGSGDYTVIWSARAAAGGETLSGAYPFAVGVAGPPGGVDGPDQWPEPWAAVLRWAVFLGTAVAGGGFAWRRLLFAWPGRRTAGGRLRLGASWQAPRSSLSWPR